MAEETTKAGESRRDLLKKGAAVGAVAWSAPLLLSSTAFAATTECGVSQFCVNYCFAKFGGSGGAQLSDTSDGACANPLGTTRCGKTVSFNRCTGATVTGTGLDITVTFPANAVPLAVTVKPGNDCVTFTYDGNNWGPTPSQVYSGGGNKPCTVTVQKISAKVVRFYQTGEGCNGYSHHNLYYCT
jgi:hypothetical protein